MKKLDKKSKKALLSKESRVGIIISFVVFVFSVFWIFSYILIETTSFWFYLAPLLTALASFVLFFLSVLNELRHKKTKE